MNSSGSFDQLMDRLISQIDIEVVLTVQAITAVVKSAMNFWPKTREVYTDWMAPFIALLIGILYAFVRDGAGWDSVLHGCALGGGAVVFSQLFKHSVTGYRVLTGRSKDDPVIQHKVRQTSSSVEQKIEKMKALLKKRKEGDQP